MTYELECIDGPDGCKGDVLMRWPGYGDKSWPRCQKHADARLEHEDDAIYRYANPDGPCEPMGFDPYDAGESWEAA